jgi:hypothetical protein
MGMQTYSGNINVGQTTVWNMDTRRTTLKGAYTSLEYAGDSGGQPLFSAQTGDYQGYVGSSGQWIWKNSVYDSLGE